MNEISIIFNFFLKLNLKLNIIINMSSLSLLYEGNSEATIYCGNLDSRVTEEMI